MLKRIYKQSGKLVWNFFSGGNKNDFTSYLVRQILIVNLFCFLGIIAFTVFGIEALFRDKVLFGIILLIADAFTIGLIFILRRTKNIRIAGNTMIAILFFVCFYLIFSIARIDSTATMWLYVFPPTALFATGRKRGLYLSLILIISAFLMMTFIDELNTKYDVFFMSRYFATLLVVTLLSFVFEYIRAKTFDAFVIADERKNIYLKQVQNQNEEILQQNEEILQQKEEIIVQKESIEKQNNLLNETNELLSVKNKQITDSINYAQRIQDALLPSDELLEKCFEKFFVFFKPRDIVSGDFYWIKEFNKKIIFAVADCTGHGVPGGFVSMIGNSLLNEIVSKGIIQPNLILDELNTMVVNMLNKGGKRNGLNDGMDISLCCIDKEKKILRMACAVQKPFIISNDNEIIDIKGDFYSIGEPRIIRKKLKFKSFEYSYSPGDKLYMFTDGFPDQFGGENNEKFSGKRLIELISENHTKSFEEQKEIISNSFNNWINPDKKETPDYKQIDDVLIAGIEL